MNLEQPQNKIGKGIEKVEKIDSSEKGNESFEDRIENIKKRIPELKRRLGRLTLAGSIRTLEDEFDTYSEKRKERAISGLESYLEGDLEKQVSEDNSEKIEDSKDEIDQTENREVLEKTSENLKKMLTVFIRRSEEGLDPLVSNEQLRDFSNLKIGSDNFIDNIDNITKLVKNIGTIRNNGLSREKLEALEVLGVTFKKLELGLVDLNNSIEDTEKKGEIKELLDVINERKKFLYKKYEMTRNYSRR